MAKKPRISKDAFDWVKDTSGEEQEKPVDSSKAPTKPARKTTAKKPAAKKPAAKKPAPKPAARKTTTAKKPAAKPAARKTATAKKPAAKPMPKKSPAAKKPATKKTTAKAPAKKVKKTTSPAPVSAAAPAEGRLVAVRFKNDGTILGMTDVTRSQAESGSLPFNTLAAGEKAGWFAVPDEFQSKKLMVIYRNCRIDTSGKTARMVIRK